MAITKKMRDAMNMFMHFCEVNSLEYEHTEVLLRRMQRTKLTMTPANLTLVWKEMLEEYYVEHPYERPPDRSDRASGPSAHEVEVAAMSADAYRQRLKTDPAFAKLENGDE